MSEPEDRQASTEVSDIWQWMVQSVLGVALVAGTFALFHYYAPATAQAPQQEEELRKQVGQLSQQVAELEKEQATWIFSELRCPEGHPFPWPPYRD